MESNGPLLFPNKKDLEMIIEMCEKLYPNWAKNWKYSYDLQYIEIEKDDGHISTHWYEFLIRWIIPKIDIPFSSQWRAFVIDSKDPIQPVYDEFKRRKL